MFLRTGDQVSAWLIQDHVMANHGSEDTLELRMVPRYPVERP